jgi:hypothetical protein
MKHINVVFAGGGKLSGLLLAGWIGGAAALTGADAGLVITYKGLNYSQTGPAAVTPRTGDGFAEFHSFVNMTAPNSVLSASVRSPAPVVYPMALDGSQLSYQARFASQAAMDAVFTNGTYQINMTTAHDGTLSFSLALNNNLYPSTPQINDFTAAQTINPANPYTFTWQPFAGGTTNDLILFQIWDSTDTQVFGTPEPGQPGAYNGTSNAVVIPAGTLTSGNTYQGNLIFFRPVAMDVTSYPGAMAVAGYLTATSFPINGGGPVDVNPPWLQDAYPRQEHGPAALNAGVAFVFSEPMRRGYSINWSVPGTFTCIWSTNRTTLFCLYNGNLPANAVIGWTLNPAGLENFRDLAGNLLPTQSGSFTTGGQTVTPDVNQCIVYKAQYYEQTNASTVTASTNVPFALGAFVDLTAPVTATNASLAGPGGGAVAMDFEGDQFWKEAGFNTKAELDAAFFTGAYTFTINTVHDGTRTLPLTMPGDAYPNAPRISNYAAAQAINSAGSFTVNWDAFSGGTTNDFVRIYLEQLMPNGGWFQEVYGTPDYGEPGALTGANTSCVIPANTLPPGRQLIDEQDHLPRRRWRSRVYCGNARGFCHGRSAHQAKVSKFLLRGRRVLFHGHWRAQHALYFGVFNRLQLLAKCELAAVQHGHAAILGLSAAVRRPAILPHPRRLVTGYLAIGHSAATNAR